MDGSGCDLKIEVNPPAKRLLDYYKNKSQEWRDRHLKLMSIVEDCRAGVANSAHLERELLKRSGQVAQLQTALSEVQACLFKERERVLQLKEENDRLENARRQNEMKMQILLHASGMKESDLTPDDRARSVLGMKEKPKPKFKVSQVTQDRRAMQLKDAQIETLQARVSALEQQLNEQTHLLKDEIVYLHKEQELREAEWKAERKMLHQRISCLNCQLEQWKTTHCDHIFQKLEALHKHDKWEEEVLAENEKLRKCVDLCKEIMGEDFPSKKRKRREAADEVFLLRKQLSQRDLTIENYQLKMSCLESEIDALKADHSKRVEGWEREKEKLREKLEFWKRKVDEERKRRLNESEGFRSDIKLLRTKLKTIERTIKDEKLKRIKSQCRDQL